MKIVFLAGLICAWCLISVAKAAPADGDIAEEPEDVNPSSGELTAENPDKSIHDTSVSCYLPKNWQACKISCWFLGKLQGYCSSGGTCYCR